MMVKEMNHQPRNVYLAKFLTIQVPRKNTLSNKQNKYLLQQKGNLTEGKGLRYKNVEQIHLKTCL